MTEVFGSAYAGAYDTLYADKDYAAEAGLIRTLLQEHQVRDVRTVLDLGCGTGNHVYPLARLGYEVAGVDRSESMLQHARAKAGHEPGDAHNRVSFHRADLRDANLGREFDAVLMMFAVLGYQLTNDDVARALGSVRRHLTPGGLFLFDVWYGPAVLAQRPTTRARRIPVAGGELLRLSAGRLDVLRHRCTVDFAVWRIEGERVVEHVEESHEMRFFFPLEIESALAAAGMRLERLSAFPEVGDAPGDDTWSVVGVASAV